MTLAVNDTVALNWFEEQGEMALMGVDYESKVHVKARHQFEEGSEANGILFTLNGLNFMAVEDPDDGYRSSLRDVFVVQDGPKNKFLPCMVRAKVSSGDLEVVELVSVETGKTVLKFGTDNSDGYYPCFVGDFDPAAMPVNSPEKVAAREKQNKRLERQAHALWGAW